MSEVVAFSAPIRATFFVCVFPCNQLLGEWPVNLHQAVQNNCQSVHHINECNRIFDSTRKQYTWIMSSSDMAKDKAAKLLKKRGSISSIASNEYALRQHKKHGSMSTISFMDEPSHDDHVRAPVRMENTFQMGPGKKFPVATIQTIIKEVLESYLMDEKYEPELCRQMTKTLSEVLKARVKDLRIPRYKVICLVHIGQLNNQAMRMGSRCLWDSSCDTFSTFEYKNNSIFAVGTVYGVYAE